MKSYDGCWTCRLRRKKCDELRPVCRGCSSLQITCHFGEEKPTWMDGGDGQREKADEVKREVRSAAARRRGTQLMDGVDTPSRDISVSMEGEEEDLSHFSDGEFVAGDVPGRRGYSDHAWTEADAVGAASIPSRTPAAQTWSGIETASTSHMNSNHQDTNVNTPSLGRLETLFTDASTSGPSSDQELDRRFVIFYFDHFFPFIFPFYRPPLLEGGRSWVMELMVRNKSMWHTTLCLGAYFVSVTLYGTAEGHEMCRMLAWDKLLRQTDVTFKMLQRDIQEVTSSDSQDRVVETSRIMGSVIQLQRFEVSVGNFENCQTHLDAAVVLFKQILQAPGSASEDSSSDRRPLAFHRVLDQLGSPPWTLMPHYHPQKRAWSTHQAAFRFFSALLVFDDIVASTCLEEPPRLHEYHTQLLTNKENPESKVPLSLEEFVGCENWVMLQIADIAALDAWKKTLRKAGQLDMMELVARAMEIKQILLDNLARLDAAANAPRDFIPQDPFAMYNSQLPSPPGTDSTLVTRIWAHGALLYLSVVISGWQPSSASTRENVGRTLELLALLPTPALLRTVAWPFCIAGCLAEPGAECRLRSMVDALVPLRVFGAARAALEIMENAWRRRDAGGVEEWDFAACVRSLGHMVLLV